MMGIKVNIRMMVRSALIVLTLFAYLSQFSSIALADPNMPTKREMLIEIRDHLPQSIDCHQLKGLQYSNGFPAIVVGAEDPTGRMTSQQYKNSEFLPISQQSYAPGEKHYILPAFYGDFSDPLNLIGNEGDGVFAGFIAYAVAKVSEPYVEEKHKEMPFEHEPDILVGRSLVWPTRKLIYDNPGANDFLIGKSHTDSAISEKCYSPTIWEAEGNYKDLYLSYWKSFFQVSEVASYFLDHPDNFLAAPEYSYQAHESPTLLGYWMHYGDTLAALEQKIDNVETGIVLLTAPIPVLGTAILIERMLIGSEASDGYMWAEAGLSAASDALFILKLPKAAALASKVLNNTVDVNHAVNIGLKGVSFAEASLGAIYAAQGRYLESLGPLLAGAADVAVVAVQGGRISFAKLGEAAGTCPLDLNSKFKVAVKEVKTNSLAYTLCRVTKNTPIDMARVLRQRSELVQRLTDSGVTLGESGSTLAALDDIIQEYANGIPGLKIALMDEASVSRVGATLDNAPAAYFDRATNTVRFNPNPPGTPTFHVEVELAHEIHDGFFMNKVVSEVLDSGEHVLKPSVRSKLESIIDTNRDIFGTPPKYMVEVPGGVPRGGLVREAYAQQVYGLKREGAITNQEANDLLDYLFRPISNPDIPEMYEQVLDNAMQEIHVNMVDYVRESHTYVRQTEFYQRAMCRSGDVRTETMDKLLDQMRGNPEHFVNNTIHNHVAGGYVDFTNEDFRSLLRDLAPELFIEFTR